MPAEQALGARAREQGVVVAEPGDTIVKNFVMDDSLKGIVFCTPELPDSAGNGTGLTVQQTLQALKGGL